MSAVLTAMAGMSEVETTTNIVEAEREAGLAVRSTSVAEFRALPRALGEVGLAAGAETPVHATDVAGRDQLAALRPSTESAANIKERKKAKKDKKKSKAVAEWGKYGVITEADMFTKSQEFHTWLVEERKVNPETISKDQQRKEFARFMEDFNTATLPDRKYYDMESYNRRMNALRAGEFAPPPEDTYDPRADMKALSAAHKKRAAADDTTLSREKLMELRKVQNERVQAGKMRQLGMEVSQTMGVRMEDGASFDE
uniref:Uncharacterized protein n=1 Tax=Mycena chlorophos TaxID=658473 RepID=A0ABQ0LKA7_MYCCL|nr:predicted protein [Mycena chlorophos]